MSSLVIQVPATLSHSTQKPTVFLLLRRGEFLRELQAHKHSVDMQIFPAHCDGKQ